MIDLQITRPAKAPLISKPASLWRVFKAIETGLIIDEKLFRLT